MTAVSGSTFGAAQGPAGKAQDMKGTARSVEQQPWWRNAVRAGIAARAFAYVVLAYIVARIAMGALGEQSTQQPASQKGVAQAVAEQSGGHVVVFLLGAGVLMYALFCAIDSLVHHDESNPRKRWTKRLNSAWAALLYAFFGVYCLKAAFEESGSESSGQQQQQQKQWTARVLEWPAGQFLLFALGAALMGGGVYLVAKAARRKFRKYLEEHRMSPRTRTVTHTLGVIGVLGRAVLFGLVGWFIVHAAVENDPKNGKGVDGAVRSLADNAGGALLLGTIAVMLLCFGLYLVLEAKYRRMTQTSSDG